MDEVGCVFIVEDVKSVQKDASRLSSLHSYVEFSCQMDQAQNTGSAHKGFNHLVGEYMDKEEVKVAFQEQVRGGSIYDHSN